MYREAPKYKRWIRCIFYSYIMDLSTYGKFRKERYPVFMFGLKVSVVIVIVIVVVVVIIVVPNGALLGSVGEPAIQAMKRSRNCPDALRSQSLLAARRGGVGSSLLITDARLFRRA